MKLCKWEQAAVNWGSVGDGLDGQLNITSNNVRHHIGYLSICLI